MSNWFSLVPHTDISGSFLVGSVFGSVFEISGSTVDGSTVDGSFTQIEFNPADRSNIWRELTGIYTLRQYTPYWINGLQLSRIDISLTPHTTLEMHQINSSTFMVITYTENGKTITIDVPNPYPISASNSWGNAEFYSSVLYVVGSNTTVNIGSVPILLPFNLNGTLTITINAAIGSNGTGINTVACTLKNNGVLLKTGNFTPDIPANKGNITFTYSGI